MHVWSRFVLPVVVATQVHAAAVIPGEGNHGAMQGFPPPPERTVNRINHIAPDNLRWSLSHMRMILPTANIRRGAGPVAPLRAAKRPLPPLGFAEPDGKPVTFDDWLRRTRTDAMLVLHDGQVVYEGYADGVPPSVPHTLQSISKSFIGLVAAMLVDEGRLDADAPLARYVPELAQSAWGDSTLQQTLDMTTAVRYSEDLKDPDSDVMRYYAFASGTFPPPPGYDGPRNIYEMLMRLPKEGEHGKGFIYKTVNPEAVAWAVSRVTGKRPSDLVSERIWSRLGAEEDAYVTIDPAGSEIMGGGMSVGLRDLARFAEMLRLDGRYNGRQVVPKKVVAEIFRGGDPELFRNDPLRRDMVGYSYHDFWWKPPGSDGVIEAKGGFGQQIHINRAARTVIVKFASAPIGVGGDYDIVKRLDPLGFAAIDAHFARVR